MTNFKDANGVDWPLEINVGIIKKLRSKLNVDLLSSESDILNSLASDPVLLADVLYVCCQDEAEKRRVTDEQFGIGLRGDAIDSAVDAFIEEFINFSPRQKAALLRKAVQKTADMREQAMKHVEKMIDEMQFNPATDLPESLG